MPRRLTKLRIDEVSSVDKGAGEGVKIVLMKRDAPQGVMLFDDIMLRKADADDDVTGDHAGDDDKKLSAKSDEIVAEMIVAAPSLHPNRARRWLLHTPPGRELLLQHTTKKLPTLNKGNTPMTEQVDIFKLNNIDSVVEISKSIIDGKADIDGSTYDQVLIGHAKQSKRSLESILTDPATPEIREAYALSKGYRPGATD
jgi:hypothetical protein